MNQPQNAVTVRLVLGNDANRQQIEDLIDRNLRLLQLLKDGVETLDAPFDASLDIVLAKLLDNRVLDPSQKLLALDATRLDRFGNSLVADRVGIAEGQIFKLAAHLAHAQPV